MSDEKLKILEMIQNGKITPAEGMELLEALNESKPHESKSIEQVNSTPDLSERFLVVRVNSYNSKVNVNIPLSLLKATSKFVSMGMGLIPEEARREMLIKGIDISKFDFEEFVSLLDKGLADGRLVDVETEDANGITKVEVYVE